MPNNPSFNLTTAELNRQAAKPGIVAVVRKKNGGEAQCRVTRFRRRHGQLEGLLRYSLEWLPIVRMWNA